MHTDGQDVKRVGDRRRMGIGYEIWFATHKCNLYSTPFGLQGAFVVASRPERERRARLCLAMQPIKPNPCGCAVQYTRKRKVFWDMHQPPFDPKTQFGSL